MYIKKKACDLPAIILSIVLFIFFSIPISIFALVKNDMGVMYGAAFFALLSITFIIGAHFESGRTVFFSEDNIKIVKANTEKVLQWSEAQIQYFNWEYIAVLRCYTINLKYFDENLNKEIEIIIPCKYKTYLEIMKLMPRN